MIREILENLNKEDRECLMLAFDGDYSHLIKLSNHTFIGVNVNIDSLNPSFKVLEKKNQWVAGELVDGQN